MRCWKIILLTVLGAFSCRKPYNPPVISSAGSYLVVEGVINAGTDSTIIKLSRTGKLYGKTTLNPELQAKLFVESDQNNTYSLTELGKGYYAFAGLNLNVSNKYRLRITTSNGEQYQSDFVEVLNSPSIDSVNYGTQTDGLNVYVNTHDDKNSVKYYRWEYYETWRFHSLANSMFKSNGDTVLQRDLVNDDIYTCWRSDTSSTIVLGNSARLARDVITKQSIAFVASTSIKIATEYSILVKQYALSGDAYTFWENLKKNTEQLGSIFDALPSQIDGNIHCTSNPALPVIGYISVGSVTTQRIMIFNRNLPAWLPAPVTDTDKCEFTACLYNYKAPGSDISINQVDEYINYNKSGNKSPLIPINVIEPPGSPILGYTAGAPICVDCTLMGTNKQPSYWRYQ